jgi:hypothetical protein
MSKMKIENFKNPPKLFPIAHGDGWEIDVPS